jgi:hypothetical protein
MGTSTILKSHGERPNPEDHQGDRQDVPRKLWHQVRMQLLLVINPRTPPPSSSLVAMA